MDVEGSSRPFYKRSAIIAICFIGFLFALSTYFLGSWKPWRWGSFRTDNLLIIRHWQQWGKLGIGFSADGKSLSILGRSIPDGIGTHANSIIAVEPLSDGKLMTGRCGLDDSADGKGSIVCIVRVEGQELFRSQVLSGTRRECRFEVTIPPTRELELVVTDSGDANLFDHAAWYDIEVVSS